MADEFTAAKYLPIAFCLDGERLTGSASASLKTRATRCIFKDNTDRLEVVHCRFQCRAFRKTLFFNRVNRVCARHHDLTLFSRNKAHKRLGARHENFFIVNARRYLNCHPVFIAIRHCIYCGLNRLVRLLRTDTQNRFGGECYVGGECYRYQQNCCHYAMCFHMYPLLHCTYPYFMGCQLSAPLSMSGIVVMPEAIRRFLKSLRVPTSIHGSRLYSPL